MIVAGYDEEQGPQIF